MKAILLIHLLLILSLAADTFTSIKKGEPAQDTFEKLWSGYDPRKAPLEIEVLKEWEEDGAVVKVVRYCVGTFKGEKAMVAGVYGYPIGGENLPALVNIHGGGQYADANAVISNAKRGYATITVSWAGRINASQYKVKPETVKLFWAGETENPKYLVTTDWGGIDAYHAPTRDSRSGHDKIAPHEMTLDEVDSPRNSLWFAATVAARRAITFLEAQPIVNKDKIGVYGHSMGGKITVLTAATDKRLKVAVPSCGGISNNENGSEIFNATLGDDVNLSNVECPIFFLSPANDFHGEVVDLPNAVSLLKTKEYGISSSPHHNHQDTGDYIVAGYKWLDHYLKDAPAVPATPQTSLTLKTESGIPSFTVNVDNSLEVLSVDIYYTQQGAPSRTKGDEGNPKFKFWHHSPTTRNGENWTGRLPLYSVDKPLWVYANVRYALENDYRAANYYYASFETNEMNISSLLKVVTAEELQNAKVQPSLVGSMIIEDFTGEWKKDWFNYRAGKWEIKTNKLNHPMFSPSKDAQLTLTLSSENENTIAIRIDSFAKEIKLNGGNTREVFHFSPADFKNSSGAPLENWIGIQQLEIAPLISIKSSFNHDGIKKTDRLQVGNPKWKGSAPKFEKLEWSPKG